MARVGFKKAKYNKIVSGAYATLTAGTVPEFEKVIDEKFAPEYNNAELYANDALAECDYSFKKGTLSLTIADDKDELIAELFGNDIAETGGEVTSTIADSAPEFGYGHIIPKIVGGVKKFKVVDTQFMMPTDMEEFKQMATAPSAVNPNVMREGIVLRDPTNDFSFKNVSREYLMKHNG